MTFSAKRFLSRFKGRRFVAVDFDSRSLRVVQAESGGARARIVRVATADAPSEFDLGDAVAVGTLLGETLRSLRLSGQPVVMSISRGKAVLKGLAMPANVNEGELAGMVRFQVEKELPFRPEEAVIDFTRDRHADPAAERAPTAESAEVLVAAARVPLVDYYCRVAEVAGVRLHRLGLRPYANMRCLAGAGVLGDGQCVAMVDLGADETEIDVFAGESMAFSRSAVVKQPGGVASVVTEVIRSLQSYGAVAGSRRIGRLYVTGGTGVEPAVVEHLERRLDVPVEQFNPAGALGLADEGAAAGCTSALGLAIAFGATGELPFDFLHPKRPVEHHDRKRLGAMAALAAVAVLVMAGVVTRVALSRRSEDALSELRNDLRELKKDNNRLDKLNDRLEFAEKWLAVSPNWLGHWAQISILFPPCEDAYIESLRDNRKGALTFTVRAKHDQVINELGRRLAEAGYGFQRGATDTIKDEFGYTRSAKITVDIPEKVKLDLAAKPRPRPSDDASGDPNYQPPGQRSRSSDRSRRGGIRR